VREWNLTAYAERPAANVRHDFEEINLKAEAEKHGWESKKNSPYFNGLSIPGRHITFLRCCLPRHFNFLGFL
jgi:hypothetical protein